MEGLDEKLLDGEVVVVEETVGVCDSEGVFECVVLGEAVNVGDDVEDGVVEMLSGERLRVVLGVLLALGVAVRLESDLLCDSDGDCDAVGEDDLEIDRVFDVVGEDETERDLMPEALGESRVPLWSEEALVETVLDRASDADNVTESEDVCCGVALAVGLVLSDGVDDSVGDGVLETDGDFETVGDDVRVGVIDFVGVGEPDLERWEDGVAVVVAELRDALLDLVFTSESDRLCVGSSEREGGDSVSVRVADVLSASELLRLPLSVHVRVSDNEADSLRFIDHDSEADSVRVTEAVRDALEAVVLSFRVWVVVWLVEFEGAAVDDCGSVSVSVGSALPLTSVSVSVMLAEWTSEKERVAVAVPPATNQGMHAPSKTTPRSAKCRMCDVTSIYAIEKNRSTVLGATMAPAYTAGDMSFANTSKTLPARAEQLTYDYRLLLRTTLL